MVATHPAYPALALDGKRIAANTVVIALHVAALMLLLAPVSSPAPVAVEEDVTPIIIVERKPPPLPMPPPIDTRVRPVVPQTPIARPVEVPQPPSDMVYDDSTAIDIPYVEPTTDDVVDTGTPTVQALVTDRAPSPPYPRMAEARRQTGTVVLLILVDATGSPMQVDIEQSSGFTLLDQAAQKFVRARWHFVPAQQGGTAVSAYARVSINFVL